MQTTKQFINEYKNTHPVSQSFHSGLWGFARVMGCLNLNECKYKSKRAAKLALAKEAKNEYDVYVAYYYEPANTFIG